MTKITGVRRAAPVAVGALLIAGLVPALQWLGRGAAGSSAEMDVPAPIAIGVLTALVAIAGLVRLLHATGRFSARSLILLYVMLTTSVPFCNFGLVQGFIASVTAVASEHLDRRIMTIRQGYASQDPNFFPKISESAYAEYLRLGEEARERPEASAELQARQMELISPLKRFWSGVAFDAAARAELDRTNAGVLERAREAWRAIPWAIWRPVLLTWGILMVLVLGGMLLLASGFARDWIERENLPFPVAQLPLALVPDGDGSKTDAPSLFRNSFFAWGVGISVLLLLLGGLAHYRIVNIPLVGPVTFQRVDFRSIFVAPPWNVLSQNILFLSPVMIGLALLVHQDILKGCLMVFAALMGARFAAGLGEPGLRQLLGDHWQGNAFPYFRELGTGAAVAFALVMVWRNRGTILGRRAQIALWAALSAAVAMWWYAEGVRGWSGVLFLFFFAVWTILGGIALARARAEGGLPQGGTNLSGSEVAFNTGNVATHGLNNVLAFNQSFFITISALPGLLASTIEGLYLGRRYQISRRSVLAAVAVGFCVALAVGSVSFLVISYALGAQNLQLYLSRMMKFPYYDTFRGGDVVFHSGADIIRLLMIPAGAVLMAVLLFVRRRVPRFPIPPMCFLLVCLGTLTLQRAGETLHDLRVIPINVVWGPILIAFLIKGLILRYGGMDLYVRSRPVALGLIFGHALMIVAWNIYHAVASPGMTLFTGVFQ